MEAFIGMMMPVAFDYAPRGWMICEGQELPIRQYTALFTLLGVQYGGDGVNNFKLPDLRCRMPVGAGQSPGVPGLNIVQGAQLGNASVSKNLAGSASVTIDVAHLPKHTHTVTVSGDGFTAVSTLHAASLGPGDVAPAAGKALGASSSSGGGAANIYVSGKALDVELDGNSVTTKLVGNVTLTTSETGAAPSALPVPFSVPLAVDLMPPALGVNWIICVEGIFPSRG